jgi:hypothetical protein
VSFMTVKAFTEHILRGISGPQENFLLTKMTRRTFLWRNFDVANIAGTSSGTDASSH